MLAIRVTKPACQLAGFYERLDQVTERNIIYEHSEKQGNVHIHGFLVGCTVSTDTLKNWIKKDVGDMKSTEWSFKKATSYDFITYMSKGVLQPVCVKGFTEEEIEPYRLAWVPMKKSEQKLMTQYKLVSEKPETARQRQMEMLQPIIDKLYGKRPSPRDIIDEILSVIRKQKIIVGRYKIRDYYDHVMNHLKEEEFIESIYSLCTKT